jgi:hypothetical protein
MGVIEIGPQLAELLKYIFGGAFIVAIWWVISR